MFGVIFLTLMLPVEVRIIPTYSVMAGLGLINSFTGLTLPLIASATATLLFRQVFLAVPDELVEAARMDGAGPAPLPPRHPPPRVSAANVAALFVILFVYGWNQYLWPLLVATDPSARHHRDRDRQDDRHWKPRTRNGHRVMATAVLALMPPVLVVVLMQRWSVKGLAEADK